MIGNTLVHPGSGVEWRVDDEIRRLWGGHYPSFQLEATVVGRILELVQLGSVAVYLGAALREAHPPSKCSSVVFCIQCDALKELDAI
jgi:hypothetical protein